MPTTNPEMAHRALRGISEGGVRFVVLHGAEKLEEGGISDVDVAVATDPREVIRVSREAWASLGLHPILLWPYDIGGTLTVFLTTGDARDGVQLDMMFDRSGVGKYGVRSDALLQSAVDGPIPTLEEPARLIYLWRKRSVKGQLDALPTLRSQASEVPRDALISASELMTGSTEPARGLMGESDDRSAPRRHPLSRARRITNRLRSPIGYWAHLGEPALAVELAGRLRGFLVTVETGAVPSPTGQPWWYLRHVWPVTLRPGVYLSHGPAPTWCPSPSLLGTGEDTEEIAARLVASMSSRLPV